MYLEDTQCCAIKEISGLSDHANAKQAMLGFCEELTVKRSLGALGTRSPSKSPG
jgi:hypothetical protein